MVCSVLAPLGDRRLSPRQKHTEGRTDQRHSIVFEAFKQNEIFGLIRLIELALFERKTIGQKGY